MSVTLSHRYKLWSLSMVSRSPHALHPWVGLHLVVSWHPLCIPCFALGVIGLPSTSSPLKSPALVQLLLLAMRGSAFITQFPVCLLIPSRIALWSGEIPSSASWKMISPDLFIPALTVGSPPRSVYLCWYPALEGCEGWFADSLEELSAFVSAGVRSTACFGKVCTFGDSQYPFVLSSSGRSFHCFALERSI